jgi:hypothetical protein
MLKLLQQCQRNCAGLKPNVTYFRLRATGFWLQKSSAAELPLNLAWNIYAFSGSFAALDWMTARFKGRN